LRAADPAKISFPMASDNPFLQPRFKPLRINAAFSLKHVSRQPSAHRTREPTYRPLKCVGQGAFGVVFTAKAPDGETVAIKKVLQDPRYKNRELDILKLLNHRNCLSLKHAYKSRGQVPTEVYLNIVMDYLPSTLHAFALQYREERMYPPILFVKLYMFQLFAGLAYLHSLGIVHRDIKPQNILIDSESGQLKICDFGSAKILKPGEKSVSYIASRFYRAPELLFDCAEYTSAIDIWAAGCVFAEVLLAGMPLFLGQTSQSQLTEIVKIIGPPASEDLESFPHTAEHEYPPVASTSLEETLPSHTPEDTLELLKQIFVYNPAERPSAVDCMHSTCFDDLFVPGLVMPNRRPLPVMERP
jgi:glycogen synthase kinase 3 beta